MRGRTCPICAENCSLCTDANTCTECRNYTYLTHDDWCQAKCPHGYYELGVEDIGGVCEPCSENCRDCASKSVCLECENRKYLDPSSSSCKTSCSDGYFGKPGTDVIGRACDPCPSSCNTCNTGSECTQCKDFTALTPFSTCEKQCPPAFYPNVTGEIGGICARCHDTCNACESADAP